MNGLKERKWSRNVCLYPNQTTFIPSAFPPAAGSSGSRSKGRLVILGNAFTNQRSARMSRTRSEKLDIPSGVTQGLACSGGDT